jgi:hypothetical protein
MFKKHTVEMKLVKAPKNGETTFEKPLESNWEHDAENLVVCATGCAVLLLGAYFLGDTARSLIVHTAVTKIK